MEYDAKTFPAVDTVQAAAKLEERNKKKSKSEQIGIVSAELLTYSSAPDPNISTTGNTRCRTDINCNNKILRLPDGGTDIIKPVAAAILEVSEKSDRQTQNQPSASRHTAITDKKLSEKFLSRLGGFLLSLHGSMNQQQSAGDSCEPVASTSKGTGSGQGRVQRDNLRSRPTVEELKKQRKSLPLIPRINQYERHPLLQTKSGTGLSEFEMFLMSRDASSSPRRSSAAPSSTGTADDDDDDEDEDRANDGIESAQKTDMKSAVKSPSSKMGFFADKELQPRGAHSEVHPLFTRSDSGLYELEQFLMEKEREKNKCGVERAASVAGSQPVPTGRGRGADGSGRHPPSGRVLERRSTLGKLEPRTSQCERNILLEFRDETGMSELEKLLEEKHQERLQRQEKGKCGVDCACKNNQCPKCKSKRQIPLATAASTAACSNSVSGLASSGGAETPGGAVTATCAVSPSQADFDLSSNRQTSIGGPPKRVRFERQKSESDDTQNVDPNVDGTLTAATCDSTPPSTSTVATCTSQMSSISAVVTVATPAVTNAGTKMSMNPATPERQVSDGKQSTNAMTATSGAAVEEKTVGQVVDGTKTAGRKNRRTSGQRKSCCLS